MNQKRQSDL